MDLIVPDVTPSAEEDASVSAITLNNIPDDLADRLRAQQDRLPEILELGLREWSATPPAFQCSAEVLEFLRAFLLPRKSSRSVRPTRFATASGHSSKRAARER
jgi:hypothetical protein